MAKPRVFISSTFYDLRHVRADLERFVKDMGYEPVLSERGAIPYGKESRLEEYCYREIELCDILVSIVGGRFGSGSEREPYSISQMELKRALNTHKQVHIFVEKNVLAEYSTYLENKDNKKIKYKHVDNPNVYKFLEEIHALPRNNPIASFETSQDIVTYLKAQWAGIYQRLLQEEARKEEINVVEELSASAATLDRLVSYLTEERRGQDEAIQTILLSAHPAFEAVKKALDIPYRVYFTNLNELSALVKARQYKPVDESQWDDPSYREWSYQVQNIRYVFKVAESIFDDDCKLKLMTKDDWRDDFVSFERMEIDEEELPF